MPPPTIATESFVISSPSPDPRYCNAFAWLRAGSKPQACINPPCIGAELVRGFDRQRTRERQLDRKIFRHSRRARGENGAMRSEKYRLVDAVRHKDDGLAAFAPDPQHLEIHLFPG